MNERVPNIFYFHILNITKFDSIYDSKWLPLEQHHKIGKKNIFLGPKFEPSFALFGCCILHPKIYRTWSCYCLWCWGWRCSLNWLHFRQKFPKSCMELCKNSWLPKVSSVVGYIRYDFFDWYVRGWVGSNFSGFTVVHNNQHTQWQHRVCLLKPRT